MSNGRTELQNEVARALVESKAVDFAAMGNVFAKYAARAAVSGEAVAFYAGHRVIGGCIPPFYTLKVVATDPSVAEEVGG